MKVERWEEETDEGWAQRLAEEIETANNTEISQYFIEQHTQAEDMVIINYIQKDSWTWKEHPEGPFKASQIIEWKNKAEKLDEILKYVPTFPQAWNKLCPQGWAWLISDCDFGQNCGSCKEVEAPIYAKTRLSTQSPIYTINTTDEKANK